MEFNGEKIYPNLELFIRTVLSLSHGNADIERGFSRSALIMTEDRAQMNLRTLNAIIDVKEGLKYDGICIDMKLLKQAKMAYSSYNSYLENCKADEDKQKSNEKKIALTTKQINDIKQSSSDWEKEMRALKVELADLIASKASISMQIQDNITSAASSSTDSKTTKRNAHVAASMFLALSDLESQEKLKSTQINLLNNKILKAKNSLIEKIIRKNP